MWNNFIKNTGSILIVVAGCLPLASCVIIAPHVAYETPKISGRIVNYQSNLERYVVKLYLGEELIGSKKPDKDGRFVFKPVKKIEYFTMLGADRHLPPPSLKVSLNDQEYLGSYTHFAPDEVFLTCDIKLLLSSNPNGFCSMENDTTSRD